MTPPEAAPPITLKQVDAGALPELQLLYDSSRGYFLRHSGAPARPEQAAIDYQHVLSSGDRLLLAILWQRERRIVGCFDLRLDHPEPGVVWFGALVLADELPTEGDDLQVWAVRILEEWLHLAELGHEIRLALLVSDREAVRFWSKLGYAATSQSLRQPVASKQQRFVIYHKKIADPS